MPEDDRDPGCAVAAGGGDARSCCGRFALQLVVCTAADVSGCEMPHVQLHIEQVCRILVGGSVAINVKVFHVME